MNILKKIGVFSVLALGAFSGAASAAEYMHVNVCIRSRGPAVRSWRVCGFAERIGRDLPAWRWKRGNGNQHPRQHVVKWWFQLAFHELARAVSPDHSAARDGNPRHSGARC